MNPRPLDEAKNADLRGSFQALQRAAERARRVAVRTGTALVISRNGMVECRPPARTHQPTPSASPQTSVNKEFDDADGAEHFVRQDVEWGLKGND